MMDVGQWLAGLGLEKYAELFAEHEIGEDALPHVTEEDLTAIGVALGARRQILAALPALTEPAPLPAPPQEAERRQITVMFCDLVGSTALSEQLDPEDLRALMQDYQKAAGSVIERYEGHVAQYLGDGLMTYFGWPQAHEDDAERAVRASLEIVEAVKAMELQVRVGIATGPVVVGETGAGDASVPKLAVGETPNLAARLQGLAGADEIVVGPSTRRLLGGTFELVNMGQQTLKGIVEPVPAHRITGIATTEGRFEAQHQHLTPLVGREAEMAMVMARWEQAKAGEGQVIVLGGEPGIGKSRITQALRERVAEEPHTRLRYQCSPYHTNSALHPVIEQLERAAGFERDDGPDDKLDKLERLLPDGAGRALVSSLLSLPVERYPALAMSPQKQKEETLRLLAGMATALAADAPVLLIFEDAHWIDPTSQELLDLIVPAVSGHRVLAVITHRPEYTPPWTGQGHVAPLALTRLGRADAAAMVARVSDTPLPGDILDQIVAKTDGVPLFVEELTKTVLESGVETASAIPETLQDSLMARLDRLSPVKEVAQIGACIGREFSHELLAAVSRLGDNELTDALQQLVTSELVYRSGTTYTFKHALVQDAAYNSLLKSRRQQLHTNIARALIEKDATIAESEPELLAHHYTQAGLTEEAIPHWLAAGQNAAERSAYIEAVNHMRHGLSLLKSLPASSDRAERELILLNHLATPIMYTKGYAAPEAGEIYERLHELCSQVGAGIHIFQALSGISQYHMVRGDVDQALVIAEEALPLAEKLGDAGPLLEANRLVGLHCAWSGQLERSLAPLDRVRKIFDPEQHRDFAAIYGQNHFMSSCALESIARAALGYPDQALRLRQMAVTEAEETGHAFSIAYARSLTLTTLQFLKDTRRVQDSIDDAVDFATEHGLVWYLAWALLIKGWLMTRSGNVSGGIEQVYEALGIWRETGTGIFLPYSHTMIAEALAGEGEFDDALSLVDGAIVQADRSGERTYDAETRRVRGELLLQADPRDVENAYEAFKDSINVAKRQSAKLWELRAATSLARLWQSQGKTREAHDLLAPVYGWFTEGFDTADLKEAKALLAELAAA